MKVLDDKRCNMKQVMENALIASDNNLPVLLLGETGVGKDVLARYIHEKSERSKTGEFVALNCSAISNGLLEGELFGHVKGSFTGSDKDRAGLIKMADKGTLFLDEIGDLSLDFQNKIIRMIEIKEYYPVGSDNPEKSDFRLICATNKDLNLKISQSLFRQDLFFRIEAITIEIPPLRERKDEIIGIAKKLINDVSSRYEKKHGDIVLSNEVSELFLCYTWPGNIRELKHVIEHSVLLLLKEHENRIEIKHLQLNRFEKLVCPVINGNKMTLKEKEKCFRKNLIKNALEANGNNHKSVMQELGISKDTFYRILSEDF